MISRLGDSETRKLRRTEIYHLYRCNRTSKRQQPDTVLSRVAIAKHCVTPSSFVPCGRQARPTLPASLSAISFSTRCRAFCLSPSNLIAESALQTSLHHSPRPRKSQKIRKPCRHKRSTCMHLLPNFPTRVQTHTHNVSPLYFLVSTSSSPTVHAFDSSRTSGLAVARCTS